MKKNVFIVSSIFGMAFTSQPLLADEVTNGFGVDELLEVDFGLSGFYTTSSMNNLTRVGANSAVTDMVTSNGAATTVDLTLTAPFRGVTISGTTSNTLGIPRNASRDGFYARDDDPASLVISGLDINSVYDLTIFASRSGSVRGGRLARYTVNGASFQDLDATNNTSNTAVFSEVAPAADGTITIRAEASPEGNANYYYLSYLSLKNLGGDSEQNIEVSSSSLDFGLLTPGNSATQNLVISNTGGTELVISTLILDGVDSSEFALANDGCSNSVLPAGEQCTVEVTFSPLVEGTKAATLNIPSDDPDTSDLVVSLSGEGEAIPNLAPTVSIVSPENNAVLVAGSPLTFTVDAQDADGEVTRVEYYAGGTQLFGTVTAAPFDFSVASTPAGTYDITVVAYDDDGASTTSDVVTLNISTAVDSDGDGVPDSEDAFPNDPTETTDSDGDGVGDNGDAFPNDPTETADTDGDGVGDNSDAFPNDPEETVDSDGDGVGDNGDAFPNDPNETADTDGDGVGDNSDAFPNDPAETVDTDGDGVGDNGDAFPNDPTETADTDGDGVGDNGDAFPNDPTETADTDGDGVGDNSDAFPNDPTETVDTDGDGVGDNSDAYPNDPTKWEDEGNTDNGFGLNALLEVDFGRGALASSGLNNLTTVAADSVVTDMVTSTGSSTTVDLTLASRFIGTTNQGIAENTLGLPENSSVDSFWGDAGGQSSLVISDLDSTSLYQLTLFASRVGNDNGNRRLTRYSVNGGAFGDLDASGNTSDSVILNNVAPAADGSITITVEASPEGSSRYYYLSYLSLKNLGSEGGTGEQNIQLSASSLDFGTLNTGGTATESLVINNTGGADLVLSQLLIEGVDSADFAISSDGCSNSVLAAGAQCAVEVTFSPELEGIKSATLTIPSDDPDSSVVQVSLGGEASAGGNIAPTVSIVSPADNSEIQTGSPLTFVVDAQDADGSITRVEYYAAGNQLFGTATLPPFDFSVASVPFGTYEISVVAYDDAGASTESESITLIFDDFTSTGNPTVSITSPVNGATVEPGTTVDFTVDAQDTDGVVARVEYYANEELLGTSTEAPFSFSQDGFVEGVYAITAVAYDDEDNSTTSEAITIRAGEAVENTPPTVVITSPLDNAELVAGEPLTFTVDASDAEGDVTRVEFYAGGDQLFGTVTQAPFTFPVASAPPGTYEITAVAYDSEGASGVSPAITITFVVAEDGGVVVAE